MKTSYITIGIVVLVIVGGGYFMFNNPDYSKTGSQVATQSDTLQYESDNSQPDIQVNDTSLTQRYIDFSEANLATANKNNGKTVLFFAALAWCPTCQAADKDIRENFRKIPSDVTILRVDYDKAKDLKKKYAVTMQDTFVQVDKMGKEITRWNSGGQGVQALLTNVE